MDATKMTHAQAVAIIKGPREPGTAGYLNYSAACSRVYVDHMATHHPRTFTTDATVRATSPRKKTVLTMSDAELDGILMKAIPSYRPKPTADADPEPDWQGAREAAETSSMGPSGATLVSVLEGDASSYFIAADGQGRACLYRSGAVNNVAPAVQTADLVKFARKAEAKQQTAQKGIAAKIAAFWDKQQKVA